MLKNRSFVKLICSLSFGLFSLYAAGDCGSNGTADAAGNRFEIIQTGEVKDHRTGLTWMRCGLGQMWDGQSCITGKHWYAWFSWQSAMAATRKFSFADANDWRVPSKLELESIIEPECKGLKIDTTLFPETAGNKPYWTSSTEEDSPDYAWVVNFGKGVAETDLKTNTSFLVRLVRGEPLLSPGLTAAAPKEQVDLFKDDGIHDAANPGLSFLQRPDQAMANFSRTRMGRIDWVKVLTDDMIRPRATVEGVDKTDKSFDLTIVMARTKEMPHVIFQHSIHTEWLSCSNCHPSIFQPKVGANELSMDKILLGEQCGRCHGRVAFSPMECERCHRILHKDSPPAWWVEKDATVNDTDSTTGSHVSH